MIKFRLLFTEKEWMEVERIIGETPTKFGNPLLNILIPKLEELKLKEDDKETK